MKKLPLIIGGVVVIAVVVAVIIATGGKDDTKDSTVAASTTKSAKTETSTASYKAVEACDVLTEAIATTLTGGPVTSTPLPDTTANSVNVSNCSYYGSATKMTAGLLVRSALSKDAAATNEGQFTSPPADAQPVTGYGDKAYWSPSYGQFNVLAHGNWYILTFGPITPKDHTLDQAKQMADALKSAL